MNAINRMVTAVFDVILAPLEAMGSEISIILVSGLCGILGLIAFKYISYQKGIKATKDKIKAHMIEIRLYQDDLVTVGKAICKVLARNCQYIALNFGPFIPLLVPFVFVLAQLVVRYGFEPVPLTEPGQQVLAGQGTMVRVDFSEGESAALSGLEVRLPEGVEAISPLVPVAAKNAAFQEIIATEAGVHELTFVLPDGSEVIKSFIAGDATEVRWMQPERVRSWMTSILWPVEETVASGSAISKVSFPYPENDLGWLPFTGPFGVLLDFFIISVIFGVAILKPLGIQI